MTKYPMPINHNIQELLKARPGKLRAMITLITIHKNSGAI
jgi:hypothetical protein